MGVCSAYAKAHCFHFCLNYQDIICDCSFNSFYVLPYVLSSTPSSGFIFKFLRSYWLAIVRSIASWTLSGSLSNDITMTTI